MWQSLNKWFGWEQSVRPVRRGCQAFRPSLDAFEDRVVPATIVVTDFADGQQLHVGTDNSRDAHGLISLRSAIAAAEVDAAKGQSDTIVFSSTLKDNVLALNKGAIALTAGSGRVTLEVGEGITFNGQGDSSFFRVDEGANATIENATFENGSASFGGAIYNKGNLTISSCTFTDNTASVGGAIYNDGILNVSHSTFSGNSATSWGGAIYNKLGLTASNSTFNNNSALSGGAIFDSEPVGPIVVGEQLSPVYLNLSSSSFVNNAASNGGAIAIQYPQEISTFSSQNLTFSGNTASNSGANVYVPPGPVAVPM